MCAASSRRWDEKSFINTYDKLKSMDQKLDLGHTNQLGNTLMHCVVKRHWADTVQKLIADGAPCDVPNSRGVTPLMMAAARNHPEETGYLVGTGAKVLQEDERGCTAICYAAVSLQQKRLKKPHKVLEYLAGRFTTRRGAQSWRAYIRRRLELLTSDGTVTHKAFHDSAAKIATSLFSYICQNILQGPEILLELNVFGRLADALSRQKPPAPNPRPLPTDYMIGLLGVTTQLLRCCQCCFGCGTTTITSDLMAECFVVSGAANSCLSLLSLGINGPPLHSVLLPIYFACSQDSRPQLWLRENFHILAPHYLQHIDSCAIHITDADDQHSQMCKQRFRKAKMRFLEIKKECDACRYELESRPGSSEYREIESNPDKKYNSKKMRRKAKALKAKIDKIRRADVMERVNYTKSSQDTNRDEEEDVQEDGWTVIRSENAKRLNDQVNVLGTRYSFWCLFNTFITAVPPSIFFIA